MSSQGWLCAGFLSMAVCLGLSGCANSPVPHTFSWLPKTPQLASTASASPHSKNSVKLQNPAKLHIAYAKLQEQLGNLADARSSYETVLGEKPKSTDAIVGLARLDQLAGRLGEAEQGYLRAIKIAPKDPTVLDAVGEFYASRGNWDKAIEMLQRAVEVAPDAAMTRQHLAVALARSGDVNAALPQFVKTVGESAAHYNIGLILYEEGKVDEAERYLLQAVVKQPDLQDAQYWLDEIRQERESREIVAANSEVAGRYEELPPPSTTQPKQSPRDGIPLPTDVQPATTSGSPPFVGGQRPILSPAGPEPTQMEEIQSSLATTRPTPSSMTPQQREQWLNSMTPAQREQWQNQMN